MILDAHTHIGFNDVLKARPSQLIASMKKAKIRRACVFAGDLNGCSTERLLKEVRAYRGILFPIGSISLFKKTSSVRDVQRWLSKGDIHGLKFYTGYEYFYPFDRRLRPYLKLLSQYGKPAIFHSGDTYNVVGKAKLKYAHPLHIDELAVEMPQLKIVIAHMGYPWVADAAEVCYKNKNVYADTSGFVYGTFTKNDEALFKGILRIYTAIAGSLDKVLFGTDWPLPDQQSYAACIRKLVQGHPSVMGQTADYVYGLS